jgi:hypothetical protein
MKISSLDLSQKPRYNNLYHEIYSKDRTLELLFRLRSRLSSVIFSGSIKVS